MSAAIASEGQAKRAMLKLGAALALAAAPAQAWAQQQSGPLHGLVDAPADLKLSGSFRLRYEGISGQVRPGFDNEDHVVSVRTTLFGEYDTGTLRFGAEIYDSRVYGAGPGSAISANDANTLEAVQAYAAADFDAPFGEGSSASIQAGRFTMNLGSRRLVAGDDYRNTTNGFTGVRADLRTQGGAAATLLYMLPQRRLPDDAASVFDNEHRFDRESFNLRLWGGIASRANLVAGAMGEVTYLRLQERDAGDRASRDRSLHTLGARIIREPAPNRIDFEAEGIRQWGSISTSLAAAAPRQDVAASFYHADLGYSFAGPWKPRLSIEYDQASGDGAGPGYGRFDTLYGMRRADLAPAGIYAALGRANISTPGVRLEVTPSQTTDAFVAYRLLWAEEAEDAFSTTGVRDPSGESGTFAGRQFEGRVRHWVVPRLLRAEANAVWLMPRGLLVDAPNAPGRGDSFYFSLAATATF